MSLDEINSPLPARRPSVDEEPSQTEPAAATTSPPPEETVSAPTAATIVATKKKFSIKPVVIAALAVILLAAAALVIVKGIGKKPQTITLTYWGLWENSSTLQSVFDEYEAQNPGIKINYIPNQKNDYRTRLEGRLEKDPNTTADIPDIFRIHSTWIPMFSGKLSPVPAAVKNATGLETDYYDVVKDNLKVGSNYYAIPLMYDQLAMFYNKDLINSAQVTLPRSWWELQEAAKKITVTDPATNQITVAGVAMGRTDNVDHWSDIVGLMLKQAGVNPTANDAANNQKIQDTLTFYTLFDTQYKVWDGSLPNSTQLFANGKLGFYFAPSWRVFDIEDGKIPTLNYAITGVPQLTTQANVPLDQPVDEANLTNINWATYWVEAVNSKSPHQAESWKFLQYMASKDVLEKLYTAQSQVRAFGEIYPRKSMAGELSSNPVVAPFLNGAATATNWYLSSRTFDAGINDEMSKYFGDAINGMVDQNQTADQVMPDLTNGISQLVQKYQIQ